MWNLSNQDIVDLHELLTYTEYRYRNEVSSIFNKVDFIEFALICKGAYTGDQIVEMYLKQEQYA